MTDDQLRLLLPLTQPPWLPNLPTAHDSASASGNPLTADVRDAHDSPNVCYILPAYNGLDGSSLVCTLTPLANRTLPMLQWGRVIDDLARTIYTGLMDHPILQDFATMPWDEVMAREGQDPGQLGCAFVETTICPYGLSGEYTDWPESLAALVEAQPCCRVTPCFVPRDMFS